MLIRPARSIARHRVFRESTMHAQWADSAVSNFREFGERSPKAHAAAHDPQQGLLLRGGHVLGRCLSISKALARGPSRNGPRPLTTRLIIADFSGVYDS